MDRGDEVRAIARDREHSPPSETDRIQRRLCVGGGEARVTERDAPAARFREAPCLALRVERALQQVRCDGERAVLADPLIAVLAVEESARLVDTRIGSSSYGSVYRLT